MHKIASNNAWEWSYGKHDKQEFTGLIIVWVGTVLDGIFWIAIMRVGIFQVGVILGGSFPGGSYPGWKFSLVGVFWEGIVRGNHPGGNFPGGGFPSTNKFNQYLLISFLMELWSQRTFCSLLL